MHIIIHPKDEEGKTRIDIEGLGYQIFKGMQAAIFGDKSDAPSIKKELSRIVDSIHIVANEIHEK